VGIRDRIASKLREAAEVFQKAPSGLYVPKIHTEEELFKDLKGRGHYDLYPVWIRKSVQMALEKAGPVGPDEVEEACAFVLWFGEDAGGKRLSPPVVICGYRDMIDKLSNQGLFNTHVVKDENGNEAQINGARVREQIDLAENTRRAGSLLVLAWNAEKGHRNFGYFHCSMHQKGERAGQ